MQVVRRVYMRCGFAAMLAALFASGCMSLDPLAQDSAGTGQQILLSVTDGRIWLPRRDLARYTCGAYQMLCTGVGSRFECQCVQ